MDHKWHGAGVSLPSEDWIIEIALDGDTFLGRFKSDDGWVNWYDLDGNLRGTGPAGWRYVREDGLPANA